MGIEIDADLDLHVGLGRLADAVGGLSRRMHSLESRFPMPVVFKGSGPFPAAGNLLVTCAPGPPDGTIWDVRSWRVTGTDPTQAPGGIAFAFVGMAPAQEPSGRVGNNWFDKTSTPIPVPAFYSRNQVVVRFPEVIYFIVIGGSVGTTYVITGEAEQTPLLGAANLLNP